MKETLEKLIDELARQRDEALAQLAQARTDDDRNNQLMVDLMRQRDELLAALEELEIAAEAFAADQSGAADDRCGLTQPVSVAECVRLLAALEKAQAAIAAVKGGK